MSFWDYAVPALADAGAGFLAGGPIGAGVGALAGLAGAYSTEQNNQHQQHSVDQQRDYETQMSNTAHQREVADLKAAGLNPVLSGDGGSGASTPSSPPAQTTQLPMPTLPEVLQAKSVAQADQRLALDTEAQNMARDKQKVDIANTTTDTDLKRANVTLAKKGSIVAGVEGRAAGGLNTFINDFIDRYKNMQPSSDPKLRNQQNQQIVDDYNKQNGTAFTLDQMYQRRK